MIKKCGHGFFWQRSGEDYFVCFFERSKYKEFRMFFLKDLYRKNFLLFFERSILYAKNFVFREAGDFPIPPPLWSSRQVDLLETNSFETPSKVNKSRRASNRARMMPQQLNNCMKKCQKLGLNLVKSYQKKQVIKMVLLQYMT